MAAQISPRRWFQWRLRTLLGVVTLCAVATGLFIAPRVRERAVVAWLNEKEASITFEPEGPEWLRRLIGDKFLQRVVGVEISSELIVQADLARFDDLRQLRTLRLCDTDYGVRFHLYPNLRNPVTMPPSLSVADVEQFVDMRPEVDCNVAFAESLYHASAHEYQNNPGQLRDVLFACQTASRWKVACAAYKAQPAAIIAAHQQLVSWLERIASMVDANVAEHASGVSPADAVLAKCVLLDARLKLAQEQQSSSAQSAAINKGAAVAAELLRITDPAAGNSACDPFQLDFDWSNAFGLLLAKARLEHTTDVEQAVLRQQVQAYRAMAAKITTLYVAAALGGESENLDLARVDLALCEAQVARARGDDDAEQRTLEHAVPIADHLRMAVRAGYEVGVITVVDMLRADQRATELEANFAQAVRDAEKQRSVDEAHTAFVERLWLKLIALPMTSVSGGYGGDYDWQLYLLRCLVGLRRLQHEGRPAFDDLVSSFVPRREIPDESSRSDETPLPELDSEPTPVDEVAPPAPDDIDCDA
jgi:hypothetical protein